MKKYPLPPLDLFHTFETVARHCSFTAGADELCLTQSAVSKQIKSLEKSLGVALFLRRHRAIELTPAGQMLFGATTRGFDELLRCVAEIESSPRSKQLTVAASVSFSYFWLMPRLERFIDCHPDIELRILASDHNADPLAGEADVAILQGHGAWEGLLTETLFPERVYPVCSAAYAQKHSCLREPVDLLNQTLLHHEGGGSLWQGMDWQVWLKANGISGLPHLQGIRINSYPMLLAAAESGRGVALGWAYITDEMIDAGRLVCPVDRPLKTKRAYYVCVSEARAGEPDIAAFRQWILDEVSGD